MAFLVALLLAIFVLDAPWDAAAIVAGAAIELGELVFWWRYSRRRRPAVGIEALVGETATVAAACRPVGQVRVRGELWRARCDEGAQPGETVEVVAVEGLTLEVRRR